MDLVPTGIPGMDEILFGGFLRENCILIEGPAGSGKTTMGIQFIHNGIVQFNEPGLIVTLEEKPKMLYRDALNFGWNLKELERQNKLKLLPSSPQAIIDMLNNPESHFHYFFEELGIKRILIDSLSHFRRITEEDIELRKILNKFLYSLATKPATILLTREINETMGNGISFEEYIVDTVLKLSYEGKGSRKRERFIEIIKSRGQDHISGKHSFIFDSKGIQIFPSCQLKDYEADDVEIFTSKRVSTGIPGLDEMLSGGLIEDRAVIIAGSSGTGKKTLGLQFLNEGFKNKEPGIFITLHNRPEDIVNMALSYHIDLKDALKEGYLEILYRSPADLIVDELLYSVKKIFSQMKVKRIVLDSLSDLINSISDESYLRDYIYSLIDFFSTFKATSILTLETTEMFGNFRIAHQELFGLIPTLISLRYVEMESEVRRALSVLKFRGSNHDKGIREYIITDEGIKIKTKFEGREGVMSGSSKKVDLKLEDILANMEQYERALKKLKGKEKEEEIKT